MCLLFLFRFEFQKSLLKSLSHCLKMSNYKLDHESEDLKLYKCDLCIASYYEISGLTHHLKKNHPNHNISIETLYKPYAWFKRQQVLNAKNSKLAPEKNGSQEKMVNQEKTGRKRKCQLEKKTENLSNTEKDLKRSKIGKRKEKRVPLRKQLLRPRDRPCGQKDYKECKLPYGWKKIGQRRMTGERWDFYVFAPNGQKFRSNVEIKKYLENHPNVKCDMEVTKISSTFPTGKPKTRG